MHRTAIIPLQELPEDPSRTEDEDGGLVSVYVYLDNGYGELRRVDTNTAINASTMQGPIEDHLHDFNEV